MKSLRSCGIVTGSTCAPEWPAREGSVFGDSQPGGRGGFFRRRAVVRLLYVIAIFALIMEGGVACRSSWSRLPTQAELPTYTPLPRPYPCRPHCKPEAALPTDTGEPSGEGDLDSVCRRVILRRSLRQPTRLCQRRRRMRRCQPTRLCQVILHGLRYRHTHLCRRHSQAGVGGEAATEGRWLRHRRRASGHTDGTSRRTRRWRRWSALPTYPGFPYVHGR